MLVCHVCHDVCGVCGEDRQVGHGVQGVEGGRRHSHSMNLSSINYDAIPSVPVFEILGGKMSDVTVPEDCREKKRTSGQDAD